MVTDFLQEIRKITRIDTRFEPEAYTFVMETLHYYTQTQKVKAGQHITGQMLLSGFRQYAIKCFGPMAKFTINSWGIRSTYDVGIIVYNMIDAGLMGKTETDSIDDFLDVYDFDAALKEDYSLNAEEKQNDD